jgi:hypothetical protein
MFIVNFFDFFDVLDHAIVNIDQLLTASKPQIISITLYI